MSRTKVAIGVFMAICSGIVAAEVPAPAVPDAEAHGFLTKFVGRWDCDGEATMEPGKPPVKMKNSMTGRMIGDLWAVIVIKGDALGHPFEGQGTFGYDSNKKKYIGTWTDSMSEFIWHYEGVVKGNKLVLDSEGPHPTDPDKTVKARDTWEFKSDNVVVLTGQMQGPDGKLTTMMTATCNRVP